MSTLLTIVTSDHKHEWRVDTWEYIAANQMFRAVSVAGTELLVPRERVQYLSAKDEPAEPELQMYGAP